LATGRILKPTILAPRSRRRGVRGGLVAAAMILALLPACGSAPAGAPVASHPAALSSQDRDRLLFTDAVALPDEGCSVRVTPPPPFDVIADSAAIHAALAAEWEAVGGEPGVAVLSVQADSTGGTRSADILETDLPADLARLIPAALDGRLEPRVEMTDSGPRPRGWSHRIRVVAGAAPRFAVGHVVTCRPSLLNQDALSRQITEDMRARGLPFTRVGRTAVAWIEVGVDGRPQQLRLNRSSGESTFDDIALGVARRAVFRPARVDATPVAAWVAIPISQDAFHQRHR
jgi:TonB family protein